MVVHCCVQPRISAARLRGRALLARVGSSSERLEIALSNVPINLKHGKTTVCPTQMPKSIFVLTMGMSGKTFACETNLQGVTSFFIAKLLLRHALGRISLTLDVWSRGILQGYMAITAHYNEDEGKLDLKSQFIAFRHTAAKKWQVGMITLAYSNDTMIRALEREFKKLGYSFCSHGNYCRCCPRVVNLAAKAGLDYLIEGRSPPAGGNGRHEIYLGACSSARRSRSILSGCFNQCITDHMHGSFYLGACSSARRSR
ncbi:hypothetical protein CYLTODRAFT_477909, partial [Cylindrobasidium torrendii FP15055 ss-10]